MLVLIIGGSGSGKSAFAEAYLGEIAGDCRKYYIATMQVLDREGKRRVERHRRMRDGKGFTTLEQPVKIESALEKMAPTDEKSALLECISNLAANEMFLKDPPQDGEAVTEKIVSGIKVLNQGLKHLVIVTNNVFEDGVHYGESTMEYMRAMGAVNERLAKMADRVIEVTAGIPTVVKEGK